MLLWTFMYMFLCGSDFQSPETPSSHTSVTLVRYKWHLCSFTNYLFRWGISPIRVSPKGLWLFPQNPELPLILTESGALDSKEELSQRTDVNRESRVAWVPRNWTGVWCIETSDLPHCPAVLASCGPAFHASPGQGLTAPWGQPPTSCASCVNVNLIEQQHGTAEGQRVTLTSCDGLLTSPGSRADRSYLPFLCIPHLYGSLWHR